MGRFSFGAGWGGKCSLILFKKEKFGEGTSKQAREFFDWKSCMDLKNSKCASSQNLFLFPNEFLLSAECGVRANGHLISYPN
jgi:hypothetical protein